MDKAQSLEERMNLAREAAGRVFQNRLDLDRQFGKSTETALQDATAARNAFLEALGMTPEVEARLKGALRKMSEEQQRTNEDVLKRGEEITQMWNNREPPLLGQPFMVEIISGSLGELIGAVWMTGWRLTSTMPAIMRSLSSCFEVTRM